MLSRQCYLDEFRDSGGCLGVAHIGFHRANGERLARSVASEDRFQRAELDRYLRVASLCRGPRCMTRRWDPLRRWPLPNRMTSR